MYSPGNNERLKLSNEDRGDRSYKVVDFELLPQTENIFVIFKDGWHPAEVVTEGAGRTEWQWTKKEATIAFRNPEARRRRSCCRSTIPRRARTPRSRSTVQIGDQVITTIPVSATDAPVLKFPVTAAQLGHRRHGGDEVHRRQDVRAGARAGDEERRPARARRALLPRVHSVEIMNDDECNVTARSSSLLVLALLSPSDARADIVVFKNGRTMSVKSCRVEAETATMLLRDGGEVTFPASIVARVDPDEVPYPEPVVDAPVAEVAPRRRRRSPTPRWCRTKCWPRGRSPI